MQMIPLWDVVGEERSEKVNDNLAAFAEFAQGQGLGINKIIWTIEKLCEWRVNALDILVRLNTYGRLWSLQYLFGQAENEEKTLTEYLDIPGDSEVESVLYSERMARCIKNFFPPDINARVNAPMEELFRDSEVAQTIYFFLEQRLSHHNEPSLILIEDRIRKFIGVLMDELVGIPIAENRIGAHTMTVEALSGEIYDATIEAHLKRLLQDES